MARKGQIIKWHVVQLPSNINNIYELTIYILKKPFIFYLNFFTTFKGNYAFIV